MTAERIVVGFDFSASGRAALMRAVARASRGGATFHFLCALEHGKPVEGVDRDARHTPSEYDYATKVQEAMSTEIANALVEGGVVAKVELFVHARIGHPADQLLTLAREIGADTIIVGTRGRTGLKRLLGSVAERVVREAGCPVEVARPKQYDDVELMQVTDVEPTHHYVAPHRYSYESRQLQLRPVEWPLY